jgi:5-methylcytosine-specific restriction endonuclease McrA
MCGKWITYLEAEHVKSKARHPELRTEANNLKPCCAECNAKKGSKDN